MTETPEEQRRKWDAYIKLHREASEALRDPSENWEQAELRISLALLHDGVADLAGQFRDRDAAEPTTHPEYHKVRQTYLYGMASNRFSSAADFAKLGAQSVIVANGGALVAMLTFLGNTSLRVSGCGVWVAFVAFVLGLVAALATVLFCYTTQSAYGRQEAAGSDKIYFHLLNDKSTSDEQDREESKQMRIGARWETAGVISFLISLLLFVVGSTAGVMAITAALS